MVNRGDDSGKNSGKAAKSGEVVPLLGVYEETKEMLQDTLDFLNGPGDPRTLELEKEDNLAYVWACKQLTAQLMSMMAWLFIQRAVQEGEITREEALHDDHRLGPPPATLAVAKNREQAMPPQFRDLKGRCGDLFTRLQKIDELHRAVS